MWALPPPKAIVVHSSRAATAMVEEIYRTTTQALFSIFVKNYRIDQTSSVDTSFGRRVLQVTDT